MDGPCSHYNNVILLFCQTASAKRRKNKNRNKHKLTTIENGDASSTASTVNDGIDSMDHTSDVTVSVSEVTNTRLPQLPVTSTAASCKSDVINGSAEVSDGSLECSPGPVLIHVGDMTSVELPNGFVNTGSKSIISNSSSSKGSRPANLGWSVKYHLLNICT